MHNGVAVGEIVSTGDMNEDAKLSREILRGAGLHREQTDVEAMFAQARAFGQASKHLHDQLLQRRVYAGMPTFVVNATFALELYLKTLTRSNGGIPDKREHKLSTLLKTLPAAAEMDVKLQIPNFYTGKAREEAYDLAAILSDLDTAFVDWRYLYEKKERKAVHIPHVIYSLNLLDAAALASVRKAVFASGVSHPQP
jgi:HEPN domain-containing protein